MFFSLFRIELDSEVMMSLLIVYASEGVLHLCLILWLSLQEFIPMSQIQRLLQLMKSDRIIVIQ